MEQHLSQLEGIRFEYLLALKTQGLDEAQAAKYAAVEDGIALIAATLESTKAK